MGDPELVSRAQRAAARLERAWERWRIRRGLGGPFAQPVASYVGYAPEEPRGRPRVVFGVDAVEAEQLAVLLDRDMRTDAVTDPRMGLAGHHDDDFVTDPGTVRFGGCGADEPVDLGGVQAPGVAEGQEPEAAGIAAGDGPATGTTTPALGATGAAAPSADESSIAVELAGWAASELPGQASAGLAAWTAAEKESRKKGGAPPRPRSAADIDREDRADSRP